MASLIITSLNPMILVSILCRFGGGVFIIERSLAPKRENCKVLGIGVAVNVSVSIFDLNDFEFFFNIYPKFLFFIYY